MFNHVEISRALSNRALPALERLAEHSALRERAVARFDRDEPPPYLSSTDEEDDPGEDLSPETVDRLLDEPLNDQERKRMGDIVGRHAEFYKAGNQFMTEVRRERDRVRAWVDRKASRATYDYFVQLGLARKGRAGRERINIVARRNVKRRWQKLGVWNNDWGIPDRADPQPNDNTDAWKWPWQHGDAAAEWFLGPEGTPNDKHPIKNALLLREALRRGERGPVPPYSNLKSDASASEAEPFITSRPWFMMGIERNEEHLRRDRLHWRWKEDQYKGTMFDNVTGFWKARGDWKEDWYDERADRTAIGWKWPRESPSPEPEDLTGLDDMASFELTPSEADALEAVRPPSPPTPRPVYQPPPPGTRPLFGWGPGGPPPGVEDSEEEKPAEQSEPEKEPQPRRRGRGQGPQEEPAETPRRSSRIAASAGKTADSTPVRPSRVTKPVVGGKQAARPKPVAGSSGLPETNKAERKKRKKSARKKKAAGKRA